VATTLEIRIHGRAVNRHQVYTEGFYTGDILEHFTSEFPLEVLIEGEAIVVTSWHWARMSESQRHFRNGLLHVALEEEGVAFAREFPAAQQPEAGMHVLIVDGSRLICDRHEALVQAVSPDATTKTCRT
jgi:hypothetical protein